MHITFNCEILKEDWQTSTAEKDLFCDIYVLLVSMSLAVGGKKLLIKEEMTAGRMVFK